MIDLKDLLENISTDWKDVLINIYSQNLEYFIQLEKNLNNEIELYNNLLEICPPPKLIFNCFNQFNLDKLKIIIIGQDPYHGNGQAMGLSFSVPINVKVPPSLKRIYQELETDLNINIDKTSGDLTQWAKQGILFLNTALTVRQGKPASHSKYWIQFTNLLIKFISEKHNGLIFLMWGNHAKKYKSIIDEKKHYFLESSHPSPLARTGWFGCKHFSKTNEILKKNNKIDIKWEMK